MGDYNKLIVWQNAKKIAVNIYKLTAEKPFSKDFGFRDQIQRAAVSIPVNIAEGEQLGSDKQSVRHFYIARGSSAELMTLLSIGEEIGYISAESAQSLVSDCRYLSIALTKLIKTRLKPSCL
jgi:four helix bundle protein